VLTKSSYGFFALLLLLSACSAQKDLPSAEHTIVGVLCMTGNEPFTRLSLQTESGVMLNIERDTTLLYRGLEKLQGRKLRVQFRPAGSIPDTSSIILRRYDLVETP
jgi:hypothetical protein